MAPSRPSGIEREDAEHHEAEVADGRIGDDALQVRLDHRDQRAVNDADDGERHEERRGLNGDLGKQRNGEA